MKSEKQVIKRLEDTVEALKRKIEATPDNPAEVSATDQIELAIMMNTLMEMVWVLDQEDAMRPLLAMIRLAAAAQGKAVPQPFTD